MTGLKFSERKDGTLEVRGLGIPFGGPINGKDLHGQFFSAKTDFAWDLIPDGARPLLYQHGLDDTVKTEVVGRWGVEKVDSKGVWVRAQLSARSSYLNEIKELLTEDALGLSSATMGHLVKVNQKNGEILTWPVVELSLTPNPANPTAYVVKSMVTPARHAAKLLRVLKHGDHDQADHGNRDGGGGSDGSEEPRGNGMGGTSRGAQRAMGLAERAVSISKGLQEKVRSSETSATPAHREVARHLSRVAQLLGTASRTTELSSRSEARGNIREANLALFDAAFAINNLPDSERGEFFDTLRSIQVLQSDMREFTINDEMFKSLKHGDHDQADHGNRDGASGGGSDGGDKPSGGSAPFQSRIESLQERLMDKQKNEAGGNFRVQHAVRLLNAATAADPSQNTYNFVSFREAIGKAMEILEDENYQDAVEELDMILRSGRDLFNSSRKKSWSRKHGDHDQADHGNRDGGGGSDGGDKPSGGSAPSSTGKPAWSGRQLTMDQVPRNFVASGRPYAREALQAVEDHIKPIDPEDPDDIKQVADFKAEYEKNIKEGFSLISKGNIGGGLSELARASARASRNDEPKELQKILDGLHDRMAATFGSSDVLDESNLEKFASLREFGARWANTLTKSYKAELYNDNILEDDAEEGAPEEEANEESDTLEASLRKLLACVIAFDLQAHGAHWNVVGPDFSEYHALFGEVYEDVHDSIDPLAENIRKIGGLAPFSLAEVADKPEVAAPSGSTDAATLTQELIDANDYVLGEIAEAFTKATADGKQGIANFLAERQDAHEKWAWQLASSLGSTSPIEESTEEVQDETETETLLASPVASLAILAGKRSRAEEDLAAVKAALKAEIRKQTLVAIGRTRDRK